MPPELPGAPFAMLDPEACLDLFWPSGLPNRFEDLAVKAIVVTTNYFDRSGRFDAIPAVFRPVIFRDECSLTAAL